MKKLALIAGLGVGLCPRPAAPHETLTTTVLFDREIVRILNKHCVMCHVENGPSFPLATYEQTWLARRKIHAETISRHMPPWAAVPGYGEFANDNNLTLRETQFIVSWVEGLGPRNSGTVFTNTAEAAARQKDIRASADFSHWQFGQPDLTRRLPPVTIEPHQPDQVKRVVIDSGVSTDRPLRAVEFMPGDRRVVRAAFFTVQETGQWIGSWTPWYGYMSVPKGSAYRLSAGAHIVAEIYYRGAKERVVDQGTLGLFFTTGPAPASVSDIVLESKPAAVKFRAVARLAAATQILALRPEFQPGIKSLEVAALKPDGGTQVLLFAKDIPAGWPTPYILKHPVALPKGTGLSVTAYGSPIRLTVSAIAR